MHEQFLLAALEQAQMGRGLCAPNPSVGAVAVQNNVIVARAWHKGAGTPHAEQLLLAQIPPNTPGVCLYITLEPCNHWGKTPPCVDAIIHHGVDEVVFSYRDPNPLVAQNDSSARLRAHGIKVSHVPLQAIDAFYKSYAHWTQTGMPHVTVKIAQALDGTIGRAGGDRLILSNALCEAFTHEMRAMSDVILTTARTIQCDDPQLNVRLEHRCAPKQVAIIDNHLLLDNNARVFKTAKHCSIYHHEIKEVEYPNSSFYHMPLKNGHLDLSLVIRHLGTLGFHDVWVESGGALFSALHQQGLVDKTYIYIVPTSIAGPGISAYQSAGLFDRPHTVTWQAMGDNMIACLEWLED